MEQMPKILIVDDESSIREMLEVVFKRDRYKVDSVASAEEALKKIAKDSYDVVVTDIAMKDMSGIELLEKVKQTRRETAVVIMTAFGTTESAVEAMKLGASDYLTKPFQIEEMRIVVKNALKASALEKENRQLRSELGKTFSFENIIGNSAAMQDVFDLVKRVAHTNTNILILGESGTGKELVAHAVHHHSRSDAAPFVVVNCAAVPESLFESELFGHKKGAFTGATSDKSGFFEQAQDGTLFLDEVGEIPLAMQAKLLRAIQQKKFRPVGGTADLEVNVRIICATNKDLEALTKAGRFREDLYYRLNVIQVRMPSLKSRKEDIPLLVEHFIRKHSLSMGKTVKGISKEALAHLLDYTFPGNVRELENIVERAVALENSSLLLPESLPQHVKLHMSSPAQNESNLNNFNLEEKVEELERFYIAKALDQAHGVKKRAAKILGITFRSLRYRIEKYGITDPNPQESE